MRAHRAVRSLPARSLAAILALPFVVAAVVPAAIAFLTGARAHPTAALVALPFGAAGLALLVACVRRFAVEGRGTLAPWDPPVGLVTGGPYGVVRNPMYVAVLSILLVWAAGFRSLPLAAYAAVMAIAFHLRVVLYEEPRLRSRFGPPFARYVSRVHRWLPKRGSGLGS